MTLEQLTSYPWSRVPVGGGFFVPCLDTDRVKREGFRDAILLRYRIKVVIGVKGGRYGVLFIRLR